MREMRPVISDDVIWHETKQRVDATETHVISLDGTEAELDLTAENAKRLREMLRPWLQAGHKPGSGNVPVSLNGKPAPPSGEIASSRSLMAVMRKFGDQHDMGEGTGYKRRPGGKAGYDYDPMLLLAFQASLKQIGHDWADHPALRPSKKKAKGATS